MGKKLDDHKPSEKADFSSIISFLGSDIRKDKKRRRGDAEKKRRDRINKCLDQLEELIPYVRQKKLCSKVDKAEVLELTVHFVKETLFEKELSFRKTHLSSVAEYERRKWLEHSPSADYERHFSALRKSPTEKCNCGCSDGPSEKLSPRHTSPITSSFPTFQPPLVTVPPLVTSPLHR